MPNIKSAIKRVTTSQKAQDANISQKNDMRSAIKTAKAAIENNADNKQDLVNTAVKKIDKAAKSNLIHSNKADRLKSQVMRSN
ncbi:30S ribosomal protein S20 [Macrococcus brunensis]|uniref:30S ribosomal protein S20 n=1 Tax=Macrococcus brunensis TaxID=198483 RepID=UPI001EF05045|nr:30S ribosomal protein S20 [Macrococcus brunensis]ULG71143.1 30S ribosomal protein S20 [Macrococcus brunensis]ULG73478.1 30S ribosomal protein S20 [Macrococcus brunensis]